MDRAYKCPVCGFAGYNYVSYGEFGWGIVERHGRCERCGYIEEQSYCSVICGHEKPRRRGRKIGKSYLSKNVRKRLRYKRRFEIKYSNEPILEIL